MRVPCALNGCASLRPTVGRYPQAGDRADFSHPRYRRRHGVTIADVALLDRIIAGGGAIKPADLKHPARRRRSHDGEPRRRHRGGDQAAQEKLKAAGVTVVDVEMPELTELNGQVGFPVALYEAYDDMVAYLKKRGAATISRSW